MIPKIEAFLRDNYYKELVIAKTEGFIIIDFSVLDRYDPFLADQVLEQPSILEQFEHAARNILLEDVVVKIRIKGLPESRHMRIRNLRAKHMDKLWQIDAIIKSASEVKPQVYEASWQCPECTIITVKLQDTNILQKPGRCECGHMGDFKLHDKKMFDTRWLVGVEPFEVTTGERPSEIGIFLKEDLTTPKMQRKTDPGNRLKVVGVLKELPKRIKGKLCTKVDTYIEANHVELHEIEFEELDITQEDEMKIRALAGSPDVFEKLKASIAPGIWGFDPIKESVVLQIFGGVPHKLPDGSRIRGNIHILVTGDPSVGKTALLKLVADIMPRGKYVSGSGVSGAGLTATVVKNEAIGGWVLEAGALILCNKGLISIDEFDKMSKDDQIAMHEATSVETVSIAKASIVATLPAQTAVLAGANPKLGRFDPFVPIIEQIQIPETLLTRFDLKFALRDTPEKVQDERIAEHVLQSRMNPDVVKPLIDMNILRKYIAFARCIKDIELSEEAASLIKNFYLEMRGRYTQEEVPAVSLTLRQYEALLRLAEASAKVRLDNKVRLEDAHRAINLMKYSLSQLGYDYESGRIDIDRMESGVTATRRRKISQIMDVLERMLKDAKEVYIEDLKAEAETLGIEGIDEVLDRLIRDGVLFEPKSGYLRKV